MDTLRGPLSDHDEAFSATADENDADAGTSRPTAAADERRMQVRAYNFWASLLGERSIPDVASLRPEQLDDFGPHSVLLDFTDGLDDPTIAFLGAELALESEAHAPIERLSQVPARSLLSRITDHYLQIIANQAPVGFEAEFVNQRGATILYRGILMPFSSDGQTIDFIYGAINWKERAQKSPRNPGENPGQHTGQPEIRAQGDERGLERMPAMLRDPAGAPLTEWADGPVDLRAEPQAVGASNSVNFPEPGFLLPADFEHVANPALTTPPAVLADWLASAREQAQAARSSEERSHTALYAAIGRAHDFALAAAQAPVDFAAIMTEAGLTMQERAPFTPIVKLVFGTDYDRTRLAEFATALAHASRLGLPRASLASHLSCFPGGLKGVVREERALRRGEPGQSTGRTALRLASELRALDARPLADIAREGAEFTVLVARRLPDGQVVLVGEIDGDDTLLQRAARHLLS